MNACQPPGSTASGEFDPLSIAIAKLAILLAKGLLLFLGVSDHRVTLPDHAGQVDLSGIKVPTSTTASTTPDAPVLIAGGDEAITSNPSRSGSIIVLWSIG